MATSSSFSSLTLSESTSSLTSAAPLPSSQADAADAERPTLLVLDNTTATALASTTTSAGTAAATSPSGSSIGNASGGGGGGSCCSNNSSTATSPSFLPEMPQWKKDLIQRRKTNVARTIGAAAAAITPTSPSSSSLSSTTATSLSSSLQQRGSVTLSDQQQQQSQQQQQQDITDGLESPARKDFTLKSTTVYQTQQQQQHSTTKVSTTSQQLQIINAKSNLATTTTKMPAKNVTTATLNSPTKRNSPLSTIISKDKAEKFLGGHYTPAAAATATSTSTKDEYERIDRQDIIEQHKQQKQQQMATKKSSPLSSPTKSSPSPPYTNTTSPPIPKQRSLFLASKYQNDANTKEEQEIGVAAAAACTISTVLSHGSCASSSASSSLTYFSTSRPGNHNNNSSNNERNSEKRGTLVATNANNINETTTTTTTSTTTTATATITRLTSSSLLRERIVVGAAAAAISASATDYNDDGDGRIAATTTTSTTADEVIEMQETETTRKSSPKTATTKSKNGTYASIPEHQQQLRNLMQSTEAATTTAPGGMKTNTTTTPTGANTTITTTPLLSPTVTSMLSIQSHSKYESERTSSKITNSIYTKANANATTTTTTPENCEKPFILLSNYSSALTVSGSGSGIGSGIGSGGSGSGSVVNNKISNKLQNNQFIKNQQHTAATSSANASKYYKYKTYSLQESQAVTNIPSSASGPTASGSGSPNKSLIATATAAVTATTATSSNKKKMVAVQEMMKTTQNAAIPHHHAHHAHHHHQQHHNQHHSIISGVGAATIYARQQQQINSNSNGSNKHRRSADSEKDDNFVVDTSEDLSYGPGIVSKLRCRYLSLALRESMEKQRHCMDNLRRATSLNNLLDRDDHHKDHDVDDQEEDDNDYEDEEVELRSGGGDKKRVDDGDGKHRTGVVGVGGILKYNSNSNEESLAGGKKTATFQKYVGSTTNGGSGGRMSHSQHGAANKSGSGGTANDSLSIRSRHVKRGNDSLKRARSVEALLCEKSPWTSYALNRTSFDPTSRSDSAATTPPTCVTIEDKIHNARGRLISGTDAMPPKRLTSIIDDTERPPPDLVKQTLKLFEATANRRPRANRSNGKGEVASKVANYKTIIKENKPAIVFPKPTSPTKKSAHVKTAAKPVVAAADLIGSPIGRKTSAATHHAASSTPNAMIDQHLLLSSTPKHASTSSAAAASGGSGCLSQNTPDIIPRHKLLTERASESTAGMDSPVTALTKKLEKLSIESDKHQTIKQSGSNNSNKSSSNVTTKESQAKQQQQQAHKLSAEPLNDSNEVNNDQQHDNDYSKKFVGGCSSGGGHGASGGGGGGGDAAENDKKSDRAVSGITTPTIEQQPNAEQAGTAAISSDLSDDEYGLTAQQTQTATKRVTKTALDNIAKAGTTQQFKFAGGNSVVPTTTTTTTAATSPTTTNATGSQSCITESPASTSLLLLLNTNPDIPSSVLNAAPGKQIGVIRPLLTNNTQTATTTTTTTPTNYSNISTTNTSANNQQLQHMEALKQQTTYSPHNSSLPTYNSTSVNTTSSYTPPAPPQLTSREIEKNRINEMKKIALTDHAAAPANASVSANATATASATSSLYTVINTNSSSSSVKSHTVAAATTSSSLSSATSGFSELDAVVAANNSPLWALRKKRQAPAAVAENTTMVFNFSNRKEVPDYIENDGVIFRRKRELPKPNESGFVLLGDLSLETSTDSDYDDFSLCPPSPCDVEFENANIVIDGKSSIRQKSKEATFRVQFNDTLTSTFEYPSEASLVIEDSFYGHNDDLVSAYENLVLEDNTDSPVHHHHHVAVDEIIQLPTTQSNSSPANANNSSIQTTAAATTKNILGNLPLGSAPLSFYTPVKAPIDNLFQLGVTRAPNGSSHTTNGNGAAGTHNGSNVSNGSVVGVNDILNGGDRSNNGSAAGNGGGGDENDEPESLQYIKPANDDLTIAYSEGAQKTDLLY